MSCEIFALPLALGWILGLGATSIERGINTDVQEDIKQSFHGPAEHTTENNFIAREFETPFNDKEILLKTITEHGLHDIEEGIDTVTGKVDNYILRFHKKELDKPYFLTIYCDKDATIEEKMQNLSEEYALNVQEESYLSIVENLKDNNMEIEEEEVLEDNTIVLTINID